MWRIESCHASESSAVGASRISSPSWYSANLASGMFISQQISPPTFPKPASTVCRLDPSPMPHTSRSWLVGISFR
jgi:hypothetical protein